MLPSILGSTMMDDWFDDMDRMFFGRVPKAMKTDIKENDTNYEMDIEMPGLKKEDIELTLKDGCLTIATEQNGSNEEKDENGKMIRQERYSGRMSRSFYVGEDIKEDDITAKYDNGVLKICIPKKEAQEAVPEKRRIAIEG